MKFSYRFLFLPFAFLFVLNINAKSDFRLTGTIQSEVLIPQADSAINAVDYPEFALTNTYADLKLIGKTINAGLRFEYLKHPLPGFEKNFSGLGFPNAYISGNFKKIQLTAGDFYEQFGNGLIFRTYEERSLGIDNSLRGLRIAAQPFKGLNIKAIGGNQRHFFEWNKALIWGTDAEFNLDQWIKPLEEKNIYWSVGTSFISRHQTGDTILASPRYRLNLPDNTGTYAVRTRLQTGNIILKAEYAQKFNDPSRDNGYIYKNGNVLLLSGTWSKKGMSMLLQAKRSDNMTFRSDRNLTGLSSFINHLPPFTVQHSYDLATMYPYATQPDGEWAFQAEGAYTFPRKSTLGGKYGTKLKVHLSHIRSIQKSFLSDIPQELMGTVGYTSNYFQLGDEKYYQDFNLGIEKKVSAEFKFSLMYMNQFYNQLVVEAHGENIRSNIFVGEAQYKFNDKLSLRTELQYLQTKEDKGDWLFALAELTVSPTLMFSVSDEYNAGLTNLHYYAANATYIVNQHRIMLGYGRTRAGYNCSGGICRYVPSSKGLTLSYLYNF